MSLSFSDIQKAYSPKNLYDEPGYKGIDPSKVYEVTPAILTVLRGERPLGLFHESEQDGFLFHVLSHHVQGIKVRQLNDGWCSVYRVGSEALAEREVKVHSTVYSKNPGLIEYHNSKDLGPLDARIKQLTWIIASHEEYGTIYSYTKESIERFGNEKAKELENLLAEKIATDLIK